MYLPGGLWLAKQWSKEKGVEHYAIIGPGIHLGHPSVSRTMVLEMMPAGPRARLLQRYEAWDLTAIEDVSGALRRIKDLRGDWQRHRYDDWLGNNCEHWARYIAYGVARSEQVRGLMIAAALAVGLYVLSKKAA